MQYGKMVPGRFLRRPNRFIAHIEIDGKEEICHVKNTGRCRELLPAWAQVWCLDAQSPQRKTRYDLITVQKGHRMINMDSQAPNAAAKEWLLRGGLGEIAQLKANLCGEDTVPPTGDIAVVLLGISAVMSMGALTVLQKRS